MATVIICGALPVLPQFIKSFRRKTNTYASNFGYDGYGKSTTHPSSFANHSVDRSIVPAGDDEAKRWQDSKESMDRTGGNYIALEDQNGPLAKNGMSNSTEGRIWRTVRIDTDTVPEVENGRAGRF